jgi:Sec-independent protein translocase protein TatA
MAMDDKPELADRSVGELLKQLSEDTVTLVRQELELLRAETRQKGLQLKEEVAEEGNRVRADLQKEVAQARINVGGEAQRASAAAAPEGKRAARGAGLIGAGGVFALAALGALTAFLILGLDSFMPDWLAALLVTALWAVVATVLVLIGRGQLRRGLTRLGAELRRSRDHLTDLLKSSGSGLQKTARTSRERLTGLEPPTPTQTVETLKEDAQWAKTRL